MKLAAAVMVRRAEEQWPHLVAALRRPVPPVDNLLGVDLEAREVGGRHLYGAL
jgi:hypothetical protein